MNIHESVKRSAAGTVLHECDRRPLKTSQRSMQPASVVKKINRSQKILRFRKSERKVHWAIAVPFLICYTTALILVIFYNPDPLRPYRYIFSWTHRISGVCLFLLPLISIWKSRGDIRIYFYNIRQAWVWSLEDIRWLALMGLAAVSKKIRLPEQGKFNAAEKINFMTLMSTYPLYILTGALIWLTNGAFLAWLVHFGMALIATPLISGHLFMAMINPDTRVGLSGMISGFVDRQWARHHYTRWYWEHFENAEAAAVMNPDAVNVQDRGTASPVSGHADMHPVTASLNMQQMHQQDRSHAPIEPELCSTCREKTAAG